MSKLRISIKPSMNEVYNTAGITFDPALTENYTEEEIEKAKQVKAKHISEQERAAKKGHKIELFTDEYYLDMAKSLKLKYLIGRSKAIYDKSILGCPVQDPKWAGYSYSEILEMENNGVTIPEEVRQWAHAQQEADITDYIMISESASGDDIAASSEESTNNNDLNSLQKKAKQYIIQSENAQKEAEIQYNEYKEVAKNANHIKRKKEDSYKKEMEKFNKGAKELKELENKKSQGKLSLKEKMRYKELAKMLNSDNGKVFKEVQAAQENLDTYLESLDGLKAQTETNITLAQDTIKSGTDLSGYDRTFFHKTHQTRGVVNNNQGLTTSEILNNISEEEIATIAVNTGKDLEAFSDNISKDLNSDRTIKLSEFAQDYSNLAQENINLVEGNQDDNQNDKNDEEKKDNKKIKEASISKSFSEFNAKVATGITLKTMLQTFSQQSEVNTTGKKAKKELKTAAKEILTLNKESQKALQKQKLNFQQEENILLELEKLEAENPQENAIPTEMIAPNNINQEKPTKPEAPEDTTEEKETKIAEFENLESENKKNTGIVATIASKNATSNSKYKKTSKLLKTQNNELNQRANNLNKVSADTMIVGFGTAAKGAVTLSLGNYMFTSGTAMMSNPFTYSQGMYLAGIGVDLITQGKNEIIYGAIASATGTAGVIASSTANSNSKDANAILKSFNATIKSGTQAIQDASAANGTENGNTTETASPTDTTENGNPTETTNPTDTTENGGTTETANPTDTTENGGTTETASPTDTTENGNTTETTSPTDTTENSNTTETTSPTDTTENGDTTETTNSTEETENQQNTNTQGNTNAGVSLLFTAPNAISATQTTQQATSAMKLAERGVDQSRTSVLQQIKKSNDLTKEVDKNAQLTIQKKEENNNQSMRILDEISTTKATINNATTNEEVQNAQDKVNTLSTELQNTNEDGQNILDKSVTNGLKQLLQLKNNTQNLGGDNASLKSIISNQNKVSGKTLAVGIGTNLFGVKNTVLGNTNITEGMALMASPFTYSVGVSLSILGGMQFAQGLSEIAAGTTASITGIAGLAANSDAQKTAKDAATAKKEADAKHKNSSTDIQNKVKNVETHNNNQANTIIPADEEPDLAPSESDESLLAASVSTNGNITGNTETDDKADKKLTRFNSDSIIESKKKLRKVQAIKASARG